MLSLRAFSRQLPRSARTFSSYTVRGLNTYRTPSVLQSSWRKASIRPVAAFSTSSRRLEAEGEANVELAGKLESELSVEREMRDPESMPEHLKEYLENTPFKLQDSPGQEEVILTRTFGDEKIRVAFSIDDLNNVDEEAEPMDNSLEDDLIDTEDDDGLSAPSGRANSKGASEDAAAEAAAQEDGEAPEQENETSFPAHLNITVERPGKGALQMDAVAQDGLIVIDGVSFWKDAKLLEPKGTEQESAVAKAYTGPPFGNLDEDLQVLFEKYMDERGINTTMALFIPEYIDYKEQKEYVSWLTNVKAFVE